jgi:hypothetical protein
MAFLDRICPEKQPDIAINIARETGIPLAIAAKIDRADQEYFDHVMRPMLSRSRRNRRRRTSFHDFTRRRSGPFRGQIHRPTDGRGLSGGVPQTGGASQHRCCAWWAQGVWGGIKA